MTNFVLQAQLLLTALSAFLPLIPAGHRTHVGELLNVVAGALAAGGAVSANVDDLAAKLAAIRREVEGIAARGEAISADRLDVAMARVRNASADFRIALAAAGAS